MDCVYSDLCGPFPEDLFSHKYLLIIVDERSRYVFGFLLTRKSQTYDKILQWHKQAVVNTSKPLKEFHSDGGGEYQKKILIKYFIDNGIKHSTTVTATPQHNGLAERVFRTIFNMARSMSAPAKNQKFNDLMWGHAVMYAIHIKNRLLSTINRQTTPYEIWFGIKPSLNHLRVFACNSYMHIDKDSRKSKISPRSKQCIFVGYNDLKRAYIVCDFTNQKVINSRDVIFHEEKFTFSNSFANQEQITNIIKNNGGTSGFELAYSLARMRNKINVVEKEPNHNLIIKAPSAPLAEKIIKPRDVLHPPINNIIKSNLIPRPIILPRNNNDKFKDIFQYDRDFFWHPGTSDSIKPKKTGQKLNKSVKNLPVNVIEPIINNEIESTNVHVDQQPLNDKPPIMNEEASNLPTDQPINELPISIADGSSNEATDLNAFQSIIHRYPLRNRKNVDIDHPGSVNVAYYASLSDNDDIREFDLDFAGLVNFAESSAHHAPATYEEAITGPEAPHWIAAMDDEINRLKKLGTWTLEQVPSGKSINVIGSHWIYKKKLNSEGQVKQYRARLVGEGYRQKYGIDYTETFAPVMKYKSLKLLLAIVAQHDYELVQLDVHSAFLQAELKETIYMRQPHGYTQGPAGVVCKLLKSIYGIKQAPHEWNAEINNFIVSLGFTRCIMDNCLYVRQSQNNHPIILGLFVDDILISYHHSDHAEWINYKSKLFHKYVMTDNGHAEWVLGMQIIRDRSKQLIHVNQKVYIGKLLERFNLTHCNALTTPADINLKNLSSSDCPQNDEQKQAMSNIPYRQLVGSLLYAAISTRPDIAYAVNIVSRYVSNPGTAHWTACKRILRYLSGTPSFGLIFNGAISSSNTDYIITGYCDADYANDKDDRKSLSGYSVYINGCLISWNTKKQSTQSLSTTEAEYVAITHVTTEIQWVEQLVKELFFNVTKPIHIHCDNQSAIAITKDDAMHQKTKHIHIKYHLIRDLVRANYIKLNWVSTEYQLADIYTKPLGNIQFVKMRDKLVANIFKL
jgi:hypothetical protein